MIAACSRKGNYLNWLTGKLKVAKEAITTLISENPGIDFGLAVFNNEIYDYGYELSLGGIELITMAVIF